MTDRTLSRHRHHHRAALSLSQPPSRDEPVEQLDRAIDNLHRVNRALPETVLDREGLIALGGLLTQISGALLTLTELLLPPAHHHDRTRAHGEYTDATRRPAAALLCDCRSSYLAAHASARAFHADLKR